MVKRQILVTLLVCIIALPSMSIEFDIDNSKYKRGTDFWTVDIPVKDISGAYTISFQSLPTGWRSQGNSLLIPSSVTTYEGDYPLKCSVRSSAGIVLRRTLLFKFSGSGLYLGDYPYDYNFQATTSGSQISSTITSTGTYVKNSQPLSTDLVSTKTLRSQYSALPSYTDLDKIIDTADVVLITKTIQSVIQSNLNCLAKMGYLSDFLGKIESYISIKGFRANDLKAIIEEAKKQIGFLQSKITQSQNQINGLGISALKIQLNKSLAKLQLAYSDFNTANIDTSPFELKINNFKNQLTDLNKQIQKANVQLTSDKTQINKLDGFIQELQDKLIKAQADRVNFIKRVSETQDFLSKSQSRIKQVQTLIAELDLKIKNILADKERLKVNSANLEREVDQIKSKISLSQKREADLISKMTDLKIQVSTQQLKLDTKQLNSINEMISVLEQEVLVIRQKIDQLDLQCNGVIDIKIQVLESNDIVYTFNPTQFQSFFNGFYGINAYSNFVSAYKDNSQNLSLYGYNIFSDQWAQLYGRPYESDVRLAYSTGLITNYSFNSDFQCSNYQSLINSSGKINSIQGNIILVMDLSGKLYELQVGACSRINGLNQYYPKIGNQIEWRGVKNYDNKYFVHTATCY